LRAKAKALSKYGMGPKPTRTLSRFIKRRLQLCRGQRDIRHHPFVDLPRNGGKGLRDGVLADGQPTQLAVNSRGFVARNSSRSCLVSP
jgi:hypothetical protein